MRRLFVPLLTAFALLLPGAAFAADGKIGYVNLQRALNEVTEGQAAKAKLKSQFEQSQKQLDQEQKALKAKKDELDKKRLAMDEATLRQKMGELDKELVRVSGLYAKLQKELSEAEAQATKQIFAKMQQVVSQIAEQEGFTYVLEANESGIVYAPPSLDLTNDLVRKYNATYKVSSSKK
ncbi:OmpH family outer membrane protein [Vulgatibacter sp.]|uniref:OmpH family outer membrane protein n=1 Tax=Vulgatibacter sp. TaxID=1971226 RepID=UPI00356B493D